MITAIVYQSKTGFTKQYAEMLSSECGISVYTLDEAKKSLSKSDSVIFLGWLFASKIVGFDKADKLFDVKAVCGVGMSAESETVYSQMKQANPQISDKNLFYLRGGYEPKKNSFIKHKLIGMIAKSIDSKADKTPDDIATVNMIRNGGSFVSKESIARVCEYIKSGRI